MDYFLCFRVICHELWAWSHEHGKENYLVYADAIGHVFALRECVFFLVFQSLGISCEDRFHGYMCCLQGFEQILSVSCILGAIGMSSMVKCVFQNPIKPTKRLGSWINYWFFAISHDHSSKIAEEFHFSLLIPIKSATIPWRIFFSISNSKLDLNIPKKTPGVVLIRQTTTFHSVNRFTGMLIISIGGRNSTTEKMFCAIKQKCHSLFYLYDCLQQRQQQQQKTAHGLWVCL